MLEDCNDKRERWEGVEALLQGWLRERRDLLVKYTAIASTLERETEQPVEAGLHRLCQLLVDYTSAGHFEVYYALLREAEAFADGSETIATDLIGQIGDTTEIILGFDEKYSEQPFSDDRLINDLSLLGEVLESRFELEDRLITALHQVHAAG